MRMPFSLKRSVLLCSVALSLPGMTYAADTMVVTAQPVDTATSPTIGYTATTSKGATKTDRPLVTTAQSISVVTRQQIEDQGAMDVNQALNYTAGAFTNFAGAATRYDTVALRGFHGGDVDNIFLDGLRLMTDAGSYNALQVDPWFLERIDVIKGPSSAPYGQSVPGGLVMETSKRPQFTQEGHFRLSSGNNSTSGAAFDYTNAINDQWAFRLTGMTHDSKTQYDHTREERYAISPSLLWQPDEDTSLLFRAYLQKDPSGGYHSSVPGEGSVTEHNGRTLSSGFYDGDSALDQFKRREQMYSVEFSHRFNDTWAFRSNANYSHSDVDLDQVYQIGWDTSNPDLLNRYYSGSRSSLNAYAIDNQLEADFATGEVSHTVILGAEYHQYRNSLSDASGSASQLNVVTGQAVGTNPSYTFYNSRRSYSQTGVYLQDEMLWKKWHLDLSGRYDRIVSQTDNYDYGTKYRRQDDHVSTRASLLYAFDSGISPYISYSQAITPQSLSGEDGNLLKPTTSEQYETGIKYQPVGTSDLYSVALYDLTQNDVGNRVIVGSYYVPAGKVHSQGIELEAHNQLTSRLSTIASYTLNHVRYKDSVDGNDGHTPYVTPNSMASAWAKYQFDYGMSGGAGVRYIGKQWADNENTLRVAPVTLLDASLRADLGAWNNSLKGLSLQVNVNNLTNRKYVAGCYGTGYCYWGAERSVVATVGYDF
ncbi:TonB-dependent siderophore receptor [Rouxiella badensis]|jgi:iron complex outermembrane receptor protein|uniref:Ferrioxamine B receptor n=1 Tax=Rouxiella badensis TaxID=1646377 RepID=A0A1X0WDG3_9GAMM|nr:TonB-dependent siderophore receptor [Rouxiella badensis]MCC3720645.1 TonB-dependent siderophore receptor [Rouxiella badensis]MCC3730485.1 TonB-dependent siderophore receptor [Rouxiella badensis]MCC3734696.1 TonB-dependent siderophore receptor [Rouxiella badensis]MCC3741782.1 TonB-dependent siderophore receptor [Rouxiella badensis]MCC3747783.1 TonB-dependent siderophore receptor [Rouxiella badensis]